MNNPVEISPAKQRRLDHDGNEKVQIMARKALQDLNLPKIEIKETDEEVKKAVIALTSVHEPIGEVFDGEKYFSGDFRDHPDFEEHFATLEKCWGELPSEHPKRRTFEILETLREQRAVAHKKWESGDFDPENDSVNETVWRRDGESDIFMCGFNHDDPEHYSTQKEWLASVGAQASILGIETIANLKNGESLETRWRDNSAFANYDQLMRDVASQNPEIVFAEIDPRDCSKIFLDHDRDFNFPKLTPEFLTAYFEFLKEVSPHLALDWLADRDGLEEALKKLSTTRQVTENRSKFIQKEEMQYAANSSLSLEGKSKTEFTGIELGEMAFADAVSALKLRRLVQLQKSGKLPPGPIVNFEGALHVVTKKQYFDNPKKALEVILQNPHFARQADLLLDESENYWERTEEDNLRRQKLMLEAFDAGKLDKIFDWEFWEEIPADAFEMHFAQPRADGGLDEWGVDFSGKRIEK